MIEIIQDTNPLSVWNKIFLGQKPLKYINMVHCPASELWHSADDLRVHAVPTVRFTRVDRDFFLPLWALWRQVNLYSLQSLLTFLSIFVLN